VLHWWYWVIVAVVLLSGYVAATSSRLDGLHARVDAARFALDAQLLRRSAVTLEIAASGLLDPATSVLLAGAAHEARTAEPDEREYQESRLTAAIRATFDDPEVAATLAIEPSGYALLAELEASISKVTLARTFCNDGVRATRAVRRHRLVRLLRLSGRVALPAFFEMDDVPPRSLQRPMPGAPVKPGGAGLPPT
jgi:hypothetical protein